MEDKHVIKALAALAQSITPLHYQRAKNLEAVGLSQSSKCFDDVFIFHNSTLLEIYDSLMSPFEFGSVAGKAVAA